MYGLTWGMIFSSSWLDAHGDALQLTASPKSLCHRPSDLKSTPSTDCGVPELFEDNDSSFYSLEIPSPTCKIMFTPTFVSRLTFLLIASCDSEDEYSDGLSSNSTDDFIFNQSRLPPWSSQAEHIKPLVNRLIEEESRQRAFVRLAWRPTLAATPTTSTQFFPASLDLHPSSVTALETQSSLWVPCLNCLENPTIDSDETGSHLRRTQSLPDLSSGSPLPLNNISDLNTVWRSGSIFSPKDKEEKIKRWASGITFTP
ncbi:hypothetical protein VP01_2702g1 [Puccinia sorghi]|uniref:Uncharacterized protein n=1 Tax=Puccinia sorghi TaxID=27349 RepID=A0A0L6V3K7_9BASI|nr:hypothetical protein VP01_2702g1 [Puccinia sorghi]